MGMPMPSNFLELSPAEKSAAYQTRATKMEDLLLLRPPPKEFFERGPPPSIVAALQQFEAKRVASEAAAIALAQTLGIQLPA